MLLSEETQSVNIDTAQLPNTQRCHMTWDAICTNQTERKGEDPFILFTRRIYCTIFWVNKALHREMHQSCPWSKSGRTGGTLLSSCGDI